jgi:hypothetical protein
MGYAHSRIIHDPQSRGLNLKEYAKVFKVNISEWEPDHHGRMICRETCDLFGLGPPIEPDFRAFYFAMHKLGLQGIDGMTGKTYSFEDSW